MYKYKIGIPTSILLILGMKVKVSCTSPSKTALTFLDQDPFFSFYGHADLSVGFACVNGSYTEASCLRTCTCCLYSTNNGGLQDLHI